MKDFFYFNTPLPNQKLPLFDSHSHIHYSEFDLDREEVIERAKLSGLTGILCAGTNYQDSVKAINLAKANPGFIYASVGNHPYEADKSMFNFEDLITENQDVVVAIGETGLDYYNSKVSKNIQQESFQAHCLLANKFSLPVIIHLREFKDCYEDAKKILLETNTKKAIFHCYTGDATSAREIWSYNWKTSFGLITLYPKNKELLEIYNACPEELKLHETDSPYLPPQSKRGKRNEPSFLTEFLID
jgi:TatD DNase family protein